MATALVARVVKETRFSSDRKSRRLLAELVTDMSRR